MNTGMRIHYKYCKHPLDIIAACAFIIVLLPTCLVQGEAYNGDNLCKQHSLVHKGTGTRTKYFIKLYVADLYVENKKSDSSDLLKMDEGVCLRLNIISSKITSDKMAKAIREGFDKSANGDSAPIQNEIDVFLSMLGKEIKDGDEFEFLHVPHSTMYI